MKSCEKRKGNQGGRSATETKDRKRPSKGEGETELKIIVLGADGRSNHGPFSLGPSHSDRYLLRVPGCTRLLVVQGHKTNHCLREQESNAVGTLVIRLVPPHKQGLADELTP